jgi:hypothetical protein
MKHSYIKVSPTMFKSHGSQQINRKHKQEYIGPREAATYHSMIGAKVSSNKVINEYNTQ